MAPFDNDAFDVWLFNEWANAPWCKRWDACIQIHEPNIYKNQENEKDPKHWKWLQKDHGKPIYMQEVDQLVPGSVKYPLEEINARFMSNLRWEKKEQKYYRATIAYAIALALYLGYKEIHIWGVELSSHAEYRSQRDNFIFWMGAAIGVGAKVTLHCCKGMFDWPLYGYEDFMQEDKIQRYIEGINSQLEQKRKEVAMLEGALQLAIQLLDDSKQEDEGKENDNAVISDPTPG